MTKFLCKDLAELAHQLTILPKRQRLSQIKGIEAVLALVQPDKSYPYDMVCFHITGYRSRGLTARESIPGSKLIPDLVTMAEHITRKTPVPVADLGASHRTYEQVAEDLSVSTKTVRRWRARGLVGFRALYGDGVSRLVYLSSTVKRFVEQHQELVRRGAAFRQLTVAEREDLVAAARTMLRERRMKLHKVACELAERTGRAVETIRYTLRRFDQEHPDQALFTDGGLPQFSAEHRRIWQAVAAGQSVAQIAAAEGVAAGDVAQIVREMRARLLKAAPRTCVYNELFDAPGAEELIMGAARPEGRPPKKVRLPKDTPAYLRSLYDTPLMTGEQEVDAFRRYNYLKHKAARVVEAIDVCAVRQVDIDLVDELGRQADAIRQEIVRANLRLVVSIAKKHVGWSPAFFEVVSDGNMSLMRAVEKFDYSRGYKFSTYASWAIMKNYARTIPEKHYHVSRYVTGQQELLDATADGRPTDASESDERRLAEALQAGLRDLNERERTIITSHFGLFGAGPGTTLEELGKRYGVTKERVRQIERRAIGKLKAVLSPSLAELLTQ